MIYDPSLGNDGGCTGFGWLTQFFPDATACCLAHDVGGTDGALLDCLMQATPGWAWGFVGLGVTAMIAARPLYMWGQRKGWFR